MSNVNAGDRVGPVYNPMRISVPPFSLRFGWPKADIHFLPEVSRNGDLGIFFAH